MLIITLFGCQKSSNFHFDIYEYKDNYLNEYAEVLEKHEYILNYTVDVSLIKDDSVTKGHGVILNIENKSYVLTNHHVIFNYEIGDVVEIKTKNDITLQVNVMYRDPLYDLALLDFTELTNLEGIDILNVPDEINFETIYNPRIINGLPIVISGLYKDTNIIRLSNVDPNVVDVTFEVDIYQMNSQQGISGSPVFDIELNFIGLVYAGNLQQGNLSRVYVIPLDKIIEFLLKYFQ
jgi:S1-C subfamily serine protease